MRFFVITAVSNFIDNDRINAFHADVFHGICERDGSTYPHEPPVFANTESPSTLLLSRSGRNIPQIFKPGHNLIVSARLATKLREVPNIRLAEVRFKRLVDIDYEKGNMKQGETFGYDDPHRLVTQFPDVEALHHGVEPYFELHTWRWRDIVDKYSATREVLIEELTPPLAIESVIRLSKELFNDYPIFQHGDYLMNRNVFDTLEADLDRDFFLVREYSL